MSSCCEGEEARRGHSYCDWLPSWPEEEAPSCSRRWYLQADATAPEGADAMRALRGLRGERETATRESETGEGFHFSVELSRMASPYAERLEGPARQTAFQALFRLRGCGSIAFASLGFARRFSASSVDAPARESSDTSWRLRLVFILASCSSLWRSRDERMGATMS